VKNIMPLVTIVVPAFNVAKTLSETIFSLLAQTFEDFEIIIVDDGSNDATHEIARSFTHNPRVRLINQRNRGLAGARNSGIAAAEGELIGFCDSDDIWEPSKLASHVQHMKLNQDVGVSYSGSALIDDDSNHLGQSQNPRLTNITAAHIFKRNPIGNGSSPVIRRAVFEAIAFRPALETERDWYFDETFRQSEDIECWLRIALTTDWAFEGVAGLLTKYRINANGLSASTDRQSAAWENMVIKLTPLAPEFFARQTSAARAYQYRYLARRAISDLDSSCAKRFLVASFKQSMSPLFEEPIKTIITVAAALVLAFVGRQSFELIMSAKGTRT
jgi:glycosyltransferase involved in cell wall biosynthesis